MKGGKDEESKATGPLFPRLHVNDTNKGGPRAPPRNKMALYEQFSVPSQRLNPVSSNSNRPVQESGNLAPSASSNQGFGQEKPYFSSISASQAPIVNSSEKVNPTDSGPHASRKPLKLIRRESSVHSKRPATISESSSAHPAADLEPSRRNLSCPSRRNPDQEPSRRSNRSPSRRINRNHREEDDFTVPTLLETGAEIGKKVPESERESAGRNVIGLNLNLEGRENGEERESEDGRENGEERETDLSPDDVVGVIGPKLFLKTRRAIVHQQRIFAVQVFELHRLIKVQQLIAGSPHILLEDLSCLKKPTKPTPTANLITSPHERPHSESPHQIHQKPDSPAKPTLPHSTPPQQFGSNTPNNSADIYAAPQEPTNLNTQNNPWCQPNQWLVPVMSPLEGLVYKPYSGPCPPAGSFMAPFFPSCPSVNTAPTGYGVPVPVPVPAQHVSNVGMVGLPNYFPPFNMPVMNGNPNLNPNPNVSASAVEQVSHLVLSNNNVPNRNNNGNNNNININNNNKNKNKNKEQNNSRSSCNMSQMNMWRLRNCRESELQGSTGSSPFEKGDKKNTNNTNNNSNGGFAAQWFPMGMTGMDALVNQNVTDGGAGSAPRVIRVVPHNARSATESVARIFQSIQKEKKQN